MEHKIFQVVNDNQSDYPNPGNWHAPRSQRCFICERNVPIQIFFNTATAEIEWTKIEDEGQRDFLIKAYKLDKSKYKTPIIFGSLIENDDQRELKSLPMIYTANYALSFILHADYFKPSHTEQRKEIVSLIKQGCVERMDQLMYLVTGTQRPNQIKEKGWPRKDQMNIITKFDPLTVLTKASKLDKSKTIAEKLSQ